MLIYLSICDFLLNKLNITITCGKVIAAKKEKNIEIKSLSLSKK